LEPALYQYIQLERERFGEAKPADSKRKAEFRPTESSAKGTWDENPKAKKPMTIAMKSRCDTHVCREPKWDTDVVCPTMFVDRQQKTRRHISGLDRSWWRRRGSNPRPSHCER